MTQRLVKLLSLPAVADSISRRLLPGILLLAVAAFSWLGCQPAKTEEKPRTPTTKLTIFALEELRRSGFETVVLRDFAAQNNTALTLRLFPDLPALLDTLNSPQHAGKVDLVLGLDNAFALSDSLLEPFTTAPEVSLAEISFEVPKDPARRLIPYAHGYLALLYNTKVISQPPQSFGELQDARYYSQVAVCDPQTNGLGRSTLLWSVALFGDSGFDQLWTSLRKNLRQVYPDRWSALEALRKGECGLMLGLQSTGAWDSEIYSGSSQIQAVVPQEGSFQYVEYAALCKGTPHRATALDFLRYLTSADTQQFVMYKLGLLPVNGRTPLIKSFKAIPQNVFAHNMRLSKEPVTEMLPLWLDSWSRISLRLSGF